MGDVIAFVCVAAVFLTVLAAVGHGIWVGVAKLFGAVHPPQPLPPAAGPTACCRVCGNMARDGRTKCARCGALMTRAVAQGPNESAEAMERQAAVRQIERLWRSGAIESQLYDRLVGLLQPPVPQPVKPLEHPVPVLATAVAAPPVRPRETDGPIPVAEIVEPTLASVLATAVKSVSTPTAPATPAPHVTPSTPPPAPESARPLGAVLQAFLESRNIRWGELASGMLIVGSAVGLVISLRATLQKTIPYFPALIFMLATAAIYGVGMYTLRRWRLRSTSRGLLTIALLLVPLNFLAAVLLSQPRPLSDPLYWLAVAIGLGGFGAMAWSASRELVPWLGRWLGAAIVGVSATQLVIDRAPPVVATRHELLLALAGLPVMVFLIGLFKLLHVGRVLPKLQPRRVGQLYLAAGAGLFAVAAPLGLFVGQASKAQVPVLTTLALMAPWLSLIGAAGVYLGLLVHNKTVVPAWRTSGTAVALISACAMVAAAAFSWPWPDLLIAIGAIHFVTLTLLARVGRFPVLHSIATVCLAMAVLLGIDRVQLAAAPLQAVASSELLQIVISGRGALILTFCGVAAAVVAFALRRKNLLEVAGAYTHAAGIIAGVGLLAAIWTGFWTESNPLEATIVLTIDAVAMLAASAVIRRPRLTVAASALAMVAVLHALVYQPAGRALLQLLNPGEQHRWALVLLAHSTLIAGLALAASAATLVRWLRDRATTLETSWTRPLAISALITSSMSLALALPVAEGNFALHALLVLAVASVWTAMSAVLRARPIATAAQVMATIGVCYLTTSVCQQYGWWTGHLLVHQHVEVQLIVLSAWAVVCHLIRTLARRAPSLAPLATTRDIPVERLLAYGLMLCTLAAAAWGCWPAVAEQIAPAMRPPADLIWQQMQQFVHGSGAWVVLGIVALAAAVVSWSKTHREDLVLWPLFVAAVPILVACRFDAMHATAAALGWSLGLYFLGGALLAAIRRPIAVWFRRSDEIKTPSLALYYATLSLVGAVPLLLITGTTVLAIAQGRFMPPVAGSLFDQLGPVMTWCAPLVLLAAGLAIVALREKISLVALAACGFLTSAAVHATVIPTWLSGQWLDTTNLAVILQHTAIVTSVLAIAWLLIERFGSRPVATAVAADSTASLNAESINPLSVQIGMAGLLAVLLALCPAVLIFMFPSTVPHAVATLGNGLSYVALALGSILFVLANQRARLLSWQTAMTWVVLPLAVLGVPLAAASVVPLNTGDWLSFHVLSGGWGALALLLTAAALTSRRKNLGVLSSTGALLAGLGVIFAIRGAVFDPLRPWWPMGLCVVAAVIAAAHAVRSRRESLAYLTAVLSVGALTLFHVGMPATATLASTIEIVQQAIGLVAVLATIWLVYQLRVARSAPGLRLAVGSAPVPATPALSLSRTTFIGGLILAASTVAFCTLATRVHTPWQGFPLSTASGPWAWAALGALALLGVTTLWSRDSRLAPAGLYVLALIGLGLALDTVPLSHKRWALGLVTGTAVWVALTGIMWNLRASWVAVGRQLQIRDPEETVHSVWRWLPAMSMLLTVAVVFASGCAEIFGHMPTTRTMAAVAVALTAPGLAMLGQGHLRRRMPRWSLLVAAIAAVYLGWSLVPHVPEGTFWLRLGIRTLVALGAMTAAYSLGLVRLLDNAGDWYAATRQSAAALGVASLLALVGVLLLEAVHFTNDGGVVALTDVAQVAVVLVGLAAALLSLALLKGADPLGLSEKGRMLYVYGAQIVLALLFAHIYLTRPDLFRGFLRPYWPLIVMAISYAGITFSLLARRAGLRVLAEPLERTGGFLPLLPALGFWFFTSEVSYSALMAVAAVAYVLLGATHKGLHYRVAAALAGNAALWAMMHEQNLTPWTYPSFWAIPPALSLLVAAHMNRHRLSSEQLTAARYLSITVIYLSSTGQVWLGLGELLWPPMLLALLAVIGILTGMALRVRAFLYQGMSFLALAVLSMIWHASRNIHHVWPWWAFGVVLGLGILALFGIFEKKRPEVLMLVERLKQWER